MHSFYNGVENALKRVLLECDLQLPTGEASHAELLAQANRETGRRPAVISDQLRSRLRPYMAFRHFFRHAYSFEFEWEKLRDLVANFDKVLDMVMTEFRVFMEI